LSFTALTSYKSCPLKYKYQFILNIPTKQSKALSFGNTIHETLKEYHQQKSFRKVSLSELLDMYKKNWQPYGYEDRENQIEYYKNGIEVMTKYYEKYNDVEVKSKVIEKNFKFKLGEIDVTGKIDRVDLLPDGKYEIIDYKTGQVKKEKEVREDNQLTMYKLAASEVFGYDVEKLTYFYVEDDVKISTERNEKDIEKLKKEVLEVTSKIQENNFVPTPSRESCNLCDFKEICPSAFKD
jgi:DNA helicase-2/ATP-dependent DNA helicase PcrA